MLDNHRRRCWGKNKSIMEKFKTVVCPEGEFTFLTPGRIYKILKLYFGNGKVSFLIVADNGAKYFCLLNNCAHLNGGNWIIAKEV